MLDGGNGEKVGKRSKADTIELHRLDPRSVAGDAVKKELTKPQGG
jgi:hypothetical protein